MLVSSSGLGSAFGTGWCVHMLQSEEALWLLCSGSSRNNEADALELLWLQHRSRKNSFPCCQTLPVKLTLYGYGEASRVHASSPFFPPIIFPAACPLFLGRLVVLKAFQLNVNWMFFGVCQFQAVLNTSSALIEQETAKKLQFAKDSLICEELGTCSHSFLVQSIKWRK